VKRCVLFLVLVAVGCDDPNMLCISAQPPEELSGPPGGAFLLRTYAAGEVQRQCELLGPVERVRACNSGNLVVLIEVGPDNNYKNFACDLHHEIGHMKQREQGLPLNHVGWL
jgi:hypothetical protein